MAFSNRLLAGLPPAELHYLAPRLDPIALRPRQVLNWRAEPIEHLTFVEEGLVSVLAQTGEREEVEAWLIGREGVVGLSTLLGGESFSFRRVVQVGGSGLRIRACDLRRAFEERPVLRRHLLRYAHAVLVQAAQNGACAARHALEHRLARWLLQARDGLGRDELPLTHALLSRLVGVRRASVTVALGRLEAAGILAQRWGSIVIAAPDRLEAVACDCHRIIRSRYEAVARQAEAVGADIMDRAGAAPLSGTVPFPPGGGETPPAMPVRRPYPCRAQARAAGRADFRRHVMAATGLEVFDKTLQTTNIWLDEIMEEIGPDRRVAWHALGAVLMTLRDRLPIELATHLGAQLPLLVRGRYYDQWHVAAQPERIRSLDEFLERISERMDGTGRPVNTRDATRAVLRTLSRHVDPGQVAKVIEALPLHIRQIWPAGPANDAASGAPGSTAA
ncbi:DUF2267 domain-containing protein [Falsiroseomonas sp.]|uniref:DUF2267 domain-containing protein n=1 Tax=Falsiroseomonas sp. TaxID=2870721 RepID=UPI0035661E63